MDLFVLTTSQNHVSDLLSASMNVCGCQRHRASATRRQRRQCIKNLREDITAPYQYCITHLHECKSRRFLFKMVLQNSKKKYLKGSEKWCGPFGSTKASNLLKGIICCFATFLSCQKPRALRAVMNNSAKFLNF